MKLVSLLSLVAILRVALSFALPTDETQSLGASISNIAGREVNSPNFGAEDGTATVSRSERRCSVGWCYIVECDNGKCHDVRFCRGCSCLYDSGPGRPGTPYCFLDDVKSREDTRTEITAATHDPSALDITPRTELHSTGHCVPGTCACDSHSYSVMFCNELGKWQVELKCAKPGACKVIPEVNDGKPYCEGGGLRPPIATEASEDPVIKREEPPTPCGYCDVTFRYCVSEDRNNEEKKKSCLEYACEREVFDVPCKTCNFCHPYGSPKESTE